MNGDDVGARALAERFGLLAWRKIIDGRDPYQAACLAFSYARAALDEEDAAARVLPWRRSPV